MRRIVFALIAITAVVFIQCSDDGTTDPGPPPDPAKADALASAAFQDIGDALDALSGLPEEDIRDIRFDSIRDELEEALTHDPTNGIAHLGLAIIEILEINYSTVLWDLIDDLSGTSMTFSSAPVDRHHMLMGRQMQLMVELPMAMRTKLLAQFPPDLNIARIQNTISAAIIPAFDRAVSHLNIVEGRADTEIRIQVDAVEYIVIDLGEILIFSAGVRALRGCFNELIAYDIDLFGPDGTYGWTEFPTPGCGGTYCGMYMERPYDSYTVIPDTPYDRLEATWIDDCTFGEAIEESLLTVVLHHNLENRSEFLGLRAGGGPMNRAGQNYRAMLGRLESAVTFIRNRSDETEENVIKLSDLTDIDDDIPPGDAPNFMNGWTRLEDAIGFLRNLLDGPVNFNEEIGPSNTPYAFTVDLSVLFDDPVGDWNDLLPYHRWNFPSGRWLELDTQPYYAYDYEGADLTIYIGDCQEVMLTNIGAAQFYRAVYRFNIDSPLELLDGPNGNVIDPDQDLPYFPDYTFGGMFPNMDRDEWEKLFSILDPGGPQPPPPPPPGLSAR